METLRKHEQSGAAKDAMKGKGKRGRKRKNTVLEADEPESATEATLEKIDCGLSLSGLRSFSTTVVDDLLDDWEESFESLKVGVRLDVAISPFSPRSFFVNEVTRWYTAAFFSDILAEPKYTLCEEFAKAFTMYLSKISNS
ncbi:hypothetical protein DL98DRAFT_597605 [Cadophora sp. DSE1049]|nr:hypothetical protein DL98DRAFT_597605 [Cadophora sp. DSE1049]